MPVPGPVSSQDLPSPSGCRSSRQEVGLASHGFNCSSLEERVCAGQWLPPHLSLAAGRTSEAARRGRQTPPAPMGVREAGWAHGWWQQPWGGHGGIGTGHSGMGIAHSTGTGRGGAGTGHGGIGTSHGGTGTDHCHSQVRPELAAALHCFKLFRSEIFPPDTLTSGAASIFHVDQLKFPRRQRRNVKHVILGTSSFFLRPKLGHAGRGGGGDVWGPVVFPIDDCQHPPPSPFPPPPPPPPWENSPSALHPHRVPGLAIPAGAWVRVSMPGFAVG